MTDSDLNATVELLQKEKAALLQSLPTPKPSSGDSPVEYERIEKRDSNGNIIVLEWHKSSGWDIHLDDIGE